ncbi:helix-hairpin-helix domain-containing protein [Legionella pneumophila]|uniref:helix-hairpin-helix domain-containing protein n=1 Tax=Legionella pneumophila TaxID=446 RepID=UPI0005C4338B|nr:helix-hairpin-helix domain-containing protein [Legionella pneumophila]GAN29924.1 pathogenicity locus [Legionella pneumophila]
MNNLSHTQHLTIAHPCVWDVFAAAINEARTGEKQPWWQWTKIRKKRQLEGTFCI